VREIVRSSIRRMGLGPIFRKLGRLGDARSPQEEALERDRRDNEHLRLLLAFALAPDSNCVDVGSHAGTVLEEMIRCAPRGRHIAYEPLPELHRRLCERFPQVNVRLAALSNRTGEATFTHVTTLPGYSGFRERTYPGSQKLEQILVRVETLDSSLPPGFVPTLIKVDVEGAEQQVIEGALETLVTHKPIVVFEHGRGAADHYGTQPRDIFNLLCREAQLRIFDLDGNGPYALTKFEETFERADRWNFVAHA